MPDLRELIQALTPEVPLPLINTRTTANGIDAAGNVWVYQPPEVVEYAGSGGPFLPLTGGTLTGNLQIGTGTGSPTMTLNGAAGANTGVYWQSGGTNRWRLQTDASENLGLYAYNAAGTFINLGFWVNNDGSQAGFNFPLLASASSAPAAGANVGFTASAHNTGTNTCTGTVFQYFSTGLSAGFDVGVSSVSIFDPPGVNTGNTGYLAEWLVAQSPNNSNVWGCNVAEWNIVNRGPDRGWFRSRTDGPCTGGLLIVSETVTFGGSGGGFDKNATFGFSTAGATHSGSPVGFYNNYLVEPNSTVGGTGRAIYVTGDITGTSANYPYGPLQTDGTWLHGIDHTKAVYTDNRAEILANTQTIQWVAPGPSPVATIGTSGSGATSTFVMSPAGGGHVLANGNMIAQTSYNPGMGVYDTSQSIGGGLLFGGGSLLYLATLDDSGNYVGTRATIDAGGNIAAQGGLGLYGTAPSAKHTVTGSKGANAALASLLTALAAYGIITDSTT